MNAMKRPLLQGSNEQSVLPNQNHHVSHQVVTS